MKRYVKSFNVSYNLDTLESLIDAFEYYEAFSEYSDNECFSKSIERVNKQIIKDPEYSEHGPITEEEIQEFKNYLEKYGYDVTNTNSPRGSNFEFQYK